MTFFTSSIKFSDSLTYTKPLDITSGPDTISPVLESIVKTITIKPSWDKCCLSLRTIFPTSPTPSPSTNTFPDGTNVVNFASFSFNSNVFPLVVKNIFWAGMPSFLAVSACAINCLYSPWTGIKYFGLANDNINFCSSWHAWPDTCTSAKELYTTSAPIFIKSSITLETDFSFPGIGFAEIITKSFGVIVTFLWFPEAILVNADIVSPWLPVVIITNWSSV